ncbi:hypothetical protein AURDEDRAFT_170224 [Auricularia subglabra TFB-10046 SS5]|nr:hypothetical protein AURDEDRAFT_170224 [Auricularia subglabra TFB-10046 SS5]
MAAHSNLRNENPDIISCPAKLPNGETCTGRTDWEIVFRKSTNKDLKTTEFLVAKCPTHRIVAKLEGNKVVRVFYWALTPGQRRALGVPTHPHGDPCTRCDGAARAVCDFWLCAPCCRKVGPHCKVRGHNGDVTVGKLVIKNIKNMLWRPKGKVPKDDDIIDVDAPSVVIDVDAIEDEQDTVASSKSMIDIIVVCEHRWAANPMREAGSATYETTVQIDASRGVTGRFYISDFTEQARIDLKLQVIELERLRAFADGHYGYLLAFAGPRDTPYEGVFVQDLRYSKDNRIVFLVDIDVDEIDLHTNITEEERFRNLPREWKTLGTIKVLVEAVHYSKGYCKGVERIVKLDCELPRRRWNAEDCTFTINDFDDEALKKLGLLDAEYHRIDDGVRREGGIDDDTRLEAEPFESRITNHELRLILRVHGSAFNPAKRPREKTYAESWDLTEEELEEELNPSKRRKAHDDFFF